LWIPACKTAVNDPADGFRGGLQHIRALNTTRRPARHWSTCQVHPSRSSSTEPTGLDQHRVESPQCRRPRGVIEARPPRLVDCTMVLPGPARPPPVPSHRIPLALSLCDTSRVRSIARQHPHEPHEARYRQARTLPSQWTKGCFQAGRVSTDRCRSTRRNRCSAHIRARDAKVGNVAVALSSCSPGHARIC
jgi:hypothetical protein